MRVWTVANQKGGVGKTTTVASLGGLLVQWGLRTLLIDIDPHGSLTSYFRYDPDAIEESVYSLFDPQSRGVTAYRHLLQHLQQGDEQPLTGVAVCGQRRRSGLCIRTQAGWPNRTWPWSAIWIPC